MAAGVISWSARGVLILWTLLWGIFVVGETATGLKHGEPVAPQPIVVGLVIVLCFTVGMLPARISGPGLVVASIALVAAELFLIRLAMPSGLFVMAATCLPLLIAGALLWYASRFLTHAGAG